MTIIHKFDTDKYEEKVVNWRGRRISLVLALSVAFLIILEIWVSHTVANYGEKFKSIETVKETLISENKVLENDIARLSSINRIASQSAMIGFTNPKNVKYIR